MTGAAVDRRRWWDKKRFVIPLFVLSGLLMLGTCTAGTEPTASTAPPWAGLTGLTTPAPTRCSVCDPGRG